jgi:membrane-bound serine protease (ClpP class)
MDMRSQIVAFLASPSVSSILFFVFLVCCYLEFSAPGVSIPGLVGGICLFLMLVGSFAQEAINWFDPLCVVTGIIFIVVECTLFPTLGILLFVGGGLVAYGLLAILVPGLLSIGFDGDTYSVAKHYVIHRLAWLSGAFLAALLAMVILSRYPLRTLRRSGIILESESTVSDALVPLQVGDEGIVVATLRPSGKIECKGSHYDVISQGKFVEVGTKVRIVAIEGVKIFVVPVEHE